MMMLKIVDLEKHYVDFHSTIFGYKDKIHQSIMHNLGFILALSMCDQYKVSSHPSTFINEELKIFLRPILDLFYQFEYEFSYTPLEYKQMS